MKSILATIAFALVLLALAVLIWTAGNKTPLEMNVAGSTIAPLRDAKGHILHFDQNPDQPKAMEITCVNNMKQIGLALRMWSGDHGDKFPFNVSTNAGGTMEFCSRDSEGRDGNTYLHFRAMIGTEGFTVPLILVCPQDHTRKAATNWPALGPGNVTYRLRSGTSVDETRPNEILLVCPVDGNVLRCDGQVIEARPTN